MLTPMLGTVGEVREFLFKFCLHPAKPHNLLNVGMFGCGNCTGLIAVRLQLIKLIKFPTFCFALQFLS